jgi:hypothetical protein
MAIDMIAVSSSNIRSIGWDEASSTLHVLFASNLRYAYSGVPENVFKAFLLAPSKGRFFASHIRDRYPARRV